MSQGQDDVLELLDSIDKPKTQSKRKDRKPKKRHNEDIMEFLDELASEGTPGADAKEASAGEEAGPATRAPAAPVEAPTAPTAPTASTGAPAAPTAAAGTAAAPKEQLPDPIAAVSSWWSKASPGIWEQATKAASRASETFKQSEQHIQRFDLAGIQKSLSNFVEVIVPPISRHEQLTIHVFHDMSGFPSIDNIVRSVFERVMDQVEGGGDLNLVLQKGADRHAANKGKRNLNLFGGTLENANKLCVAGIEDFRRDNAEAALPETSEARISEIFISLQAVLVDDAPADNKFQFACYMSDFTNNLHLSTASQAMPSDWAAWLDADDSQFENTAADPREWVMEWVEESIGLALGTLAQKYVILRMGIVEPRATETSA